MPPGVYHIELNTRGHGMKLLSAQTFGVKSTPVFHSVSYAMSESIDFSEDSK
jgi:hypothetical protein